MLHLEMYDGHNVFETIVIIGLPGSGKSTLAEKIKKDYPNKKFYIVEDGEYHECYDMFGKNNMILCDSYMLDINYFNAVLRDFKSKKIKFVLYYYENNSQKCIKNILKRKSHNIRNDILIGEMPLYTSNYNYILNTLFSEQEKGYIIKMIKMPIFE